MRAPDRTLVLRAVLIGLAFGALSVGLPASIAPRYFFDAFPLGASWVALLPPYNEHLVTDVGGLQLGFGLMFAWAAWRPTAALVVPLCGAWGISQVLHLGFHAANLDGFSLADAVGELLALGAVAGLPVIAIVLVRGEEPDGG